MTNGMKWVVISVGAVVALGLVAALMVWVSMEPVTSSESTSVVTDTVETTTSTTTGIAPSAGPSAVSTTTTPSTTTTTENLIAFNASPGPAERLFFREADVEFLADTWGDLTSSEAERTLHNQLLAVGYVLVAEEVSDDVRDSFLGSLRSGGGSNFIPVIEAASVYLQPNRTWTTGLFTNCFEGDALSYLNSGLGGPIYRPSDFESLDQVIDSCVVQTVWRNSFDENEVIFTCRWQPEICDEAALASIERVGP